MANSRVIEEIKKSMEKMILIPKSEYDEMEKELKDLRKEKDNFTKSYDDLMNKKKCLYIKEKRIAQYCDFVEYEIFEAGLLPDKVHKVLDDLNNKNKELVEDYAELDIKIRTGLWRHLIYCLKRLLIF